MVQNKSAIVEVNKQIFSRDEMNLAEFPLAVLSTRHSPKTKTLEFSDTVYDQNGKLVKRKWIITGADKFGLPTSSDEEVLLGLLKLTVDSNFNSRKVFFTRYELLRSLRWSTEGRNYIRLQNALDRLSGVRIKASNAFYDNQTKSYSTRNFGILDSYEINNGRDNNKPSFFVWSEVLFKSFKAGFIKKLDLDFYLSLSSAVTKRLYRYLDKHFWYKSIVKVNLFTLAHEKVGISRNYKYPSSLRQQLDPAFSELIEKGFLKKVEYCGKGKNTEIAIYSSERAKKFGKVISFKDKLDQENKKKELKGSAVYNQVKQKLIDRGLKEHQVVSLLLGCSKAGLERILKIVDYYDHLVSIKSSLISKNKVGFLYRAVENPGGFVLPGESAFNRGKNKKQPSAQAKKETKIIKIKEASIEEEKLVALKREYQAYKREELKNLKESVEKDLLNDLKSEALLELEKIKGSVSEARFYMALEHQLNKKLEALFSLPTFNEWVKERYSK